MKKRIAEPVVRRTGNIMRTVLIWLGFLAAVIAGLLLVATSGNERIELALIILGMLFYGFALRDFDVDDDD